MIIKLRVKKSANMHCPVVRFFLVVGVCPFTVSLSAQWPSIVDANAHGATRDEVRALGIDVWVPTHELSHSDCVVVTGDDIPTGIPLLDNVEQIAYIKLYKSA